MKAFITIIMIAFSLVAVGQNKNEATIKIKTSAVCEMCKTTIEKDLMFEKGVKESNLHVPSKILTVVYNTKKTDPETIRKRITRIGYDADTLKADPEAYIKLDDCCKKDAHQDDHKKNGHQ